MISSGVSMLEKFDVYFNSSSALPKDDEEPEDEVTNQTSKVTTEEAQEALENAGLTESEQMAEQVTKLLESYGLQDQVDVEFNQYYTCLLYTSRCV